MIFNSTTTWGWPAKILHWIGAAIILVLLVHGWWMTHMTPRPERLANYAWHSALGYDLLALTVLRLLWRWFNPVPELPADLKPWERVAARVGHVSLYVLMFIVSLTGWMVATTFRVPQGPARGRRAGDRYHCGSLGAPVDRGIAYGSCLPACRGCARSRHRSAASPYA
jgi:cytochrome b561